MLGRLEEAREEFARAFAESDIGRAWIAVQLAELRRAHASVDYNAAAGLLRLDKQMPAHPAGTAFVERLAQFADRFAAEALAEEQAARDAERAAYIAGTTEG